MADATDPEPGSDIALSLQELAINNGDSPPEKYMLKGNETINSSSLPLLEIATIDIGLLSSQSFSLEVGVEVRKLRAALSSSGYFQAVNHGMTDSFLDEVLEVARNFFEYPMEEKMKYSRSGTDFQGYGNQTNDWNERLYLHVHPECIMDFKKWPQNPENLRKVLLEYTEKILVMNETIIKAMAKSLNLEENCFLDQIGENPLALSRFNFYPPCPWPDRVLASNPHGDSSATTYLLQDKEVEGLQALIDDQWYRVPLTPNAILFNAGDILEIMTNGIFKSPIHRVATNKEKERLTLAMFFGPEPTIEIKPAEDLVNDKNPRLYKNVTDYNRMYFQQIQHGRRPLEAMKI